jgi:hypothetical protein
MPTPGPYAPLVTQWVAGDPVADVENNQVRPFTSRVIRVLAEYPGNALEVDNASGDLVTADRVLLVDSAVGVSDYDQFTVSDGRRYKVSAVLPYRNPNTGTSLTQVNLRRIT